MKKQEQIDHAQFQIEQQGNPVFALSAWLRAMELVLVGRHEFAHATATKRQLRNVRLYVKYGRKLMEQIEAEEQAHARNVTQTSAK